MLGEPRALARCSGQPLPWTRPHTGARPPHSSGTAGKPGFPRRASGQGRLVPQGCRGAPRTSGPAGALCPRSLGQAGGPRAGEPGPREGRPWGVAVCGVLSRSTGTSRRAPPLTEDAFCSLAALWPLPCLDSRGPPSARGCAAPRWPASPSASPLPPRGEASPLRSMTHGADAKFS